MIMVVKLIEENNLRKVWPKEAQDFTPWLVKDDNIDILFDAI